MTGDDLDPYMGRAIGADGFAHRAAPARSAARRPRRTPRTSASWVRPGSTRRPPTTSPRVVAILLGLCPKFGAIVSATPGGVLGGITVVLYGMIGLVGAKIWVENGVDFGDPVNLVGLAAGIIAGIGGVTLKITDDFSLERHRPRHDPGDRLLPPGQPGRQRRLGDRDQPPSTTSVTTHLEARQCEAGTRSPIAAPAIARRSRWRPWPASRARRCWPAARAWSRCSRCGWPPRRCSSTSTRCPTSATSAAADGRGPGRGAGPARRRARLGRRPPGPAAAGAWRWPRRPPHDPQPRHHRRLDRARRRRRRDAGRAAAARRLGRRRVGRAGAARSPADGPVRRPAGVDPRPRRDRGRGVLPGASRAGAGRRLRGDRPAARRLRPRAASPRSSSRRRAVTRARVGYLSVCDVPRPSSTSPTRSTDAALGDAADTALAELDPADDIHATAAYRAQLVRVLTAARRCGRDRPRPLAAGEATT